MPTNEAGLSGGHNLGDGGHTTASDMPGENAPSADQDGSVAEQTPAPANDAQDPPEDDGSGI